MVCFSGSVRDYIPLHDVLITALCCCDQNTWEEQIRGRKVYFVSLFGKFSLWSADFITLGLRGGRGRRTLWRKAAHLRPPGSRKRGKWLQGRCILLEHPPCDPPPSAMPCMSTVTTQLIQTRMDSLGYNSHNLVILPLHIPVLTQELLDNASYPNFNTWHSLGEAS